VSQIYFIGVTLYMFRTVFPSIIRSSRLYILQHAYVKQILLTAAICRVLFQNKYTLVHLIGFTIVKNYYAWPYERQIT